MTNMKESPPATPRFLVRELSHVEFVRRVLAQAERKRTPLLERVRYIAIVSDLIDELFQVRLTDLEDKVDAGFQDPERGDKPAHELLNQIREVVIELDTRQSRIFRTELEPALEGLDIRIRLWDDLDESDRTYFHQVFHDQVFPVLTPLAVDPAHPFPYISNLSMNLAVMVKEAGSGVERFARVKVPPILPRFIELPNRRGFLPLEQLISAHIDELFPGMQVSKCHPFRLTRNTDYELAEFEASDLMAALKSEIGRRRQGQVMRLEVERDIDPDVLDLLMRELEIKDRHVYRIAGLLGLGSLTTLADLDLPEHRWKVFPPAVPPRITAQGSFFDLISEGDFLVHHPYESFAASTAEFVHEAAHDPNVLGIKQTLYRTSSESSIARSLITAAELGKQVVALVELKARFEEQRNIERALALEEAGVHVVYGLVGLKTHAKLCLVVRQEKGGLARYVHTSTGNYNEHTARLYEDVGLFTKDPEIGADVSDLFNHMTGYSRQKSYRKLVVAPTELRDHFLELIRREADHEDGHVVAKMNGLVDSRTINALYEASNAGTRIDLIVRGVCCLRPGVPGLSENITVRSIVGRFLEHSRIFRVGRPERGFKYFMGSADLMPRNLDRRVEALFPVEDPEAQRRLEEILDLCRADDHLSWVLQPDGTYEPRGMKRGLDLHEALIERAIQRSRNARRR
ncbi:MAG: polyphosphate kinase 1 [Acidimicrobiia bacterium]|nr:polyphosphate kinase 1 [bacterium]MXX64090.1 polyphosphate kinase 1 [Acidimicrobiia bacterium]MCY3652461.1 polyphosphate kinase 1 [bacterium]MDE0642524.1 polyphosphate kinase 1 [bacterium]MXZ06416.1 polyphosphate kinase 1 [Acidimicrobiia bacterium]